MTHEHTYGCHGTDPCAPIEGQWLQPSDFAIRQARGLVPDDAPWCVLRVLAITLDGEEGAPIADMTEAEFDALFEEALTGPDASPAKCMDLLVERFGHCEVSAEVAVRAEVSS